VKARLRVELVRGRVGRVGERERGEKKKKR